MRWASPAGLAQPSYGCKVTILRYGRCRKCAASGKTGARRPSWAMPPQAAITMVPLQLPAAPPTMSGGRQRRPWRVLLPM
jgi:hypothetical protein